MLQFELLGRGFDDHPRAPHGGLQVVRDLHSTGPLRSKAEGFLKSSTCSVQNAMAASHWSGEGSKIRTWLPPAAYTAAIRRPTVPAPSTATGRSSTSAGNV
jgi:hypothetical protein